MTVQVLTQAREHIIRKTFEALKGVKNAIVHVYNSTSLAQREQVFRKSKEEIKQIAVEGAKLLKELTEEAGAEYRFEYSRRVSRKQSRNTHWKYAMLCWMYGSPRRSGKRSSISR